MREHQYRLELEWTGNQGSGTSNYRAYGRECELRAPGKPVIAGSSDPSFRGDPARWSADDLLVAAVAQCHLLWYLHLCASNGVVVVSYRDDPVGTMIEEDSGAGQFQQVLLRPTVEVRESSMCELAELLHDQVAEWCFVARSVNFPISCQPRVSVALLT